MISNDSTGRRTGPGEITFNRLLPGPIDRVWTYLVDPAKRALWLAGGPMEPLVGGAVTLSFKHADLATPDDPPPEKYREMAAGDCSFSGHITRWEPPHALAYTWQESGGSNSEVTFELHPEEEKVRLVLTHRRLSDQLDEMGSVAGGWHTHLAILIAQLAGEPGPSFWSTHTKLEEHYRRALAPLLLRRPPA